MAGNSIGKFKHTLRFVWVLYLFTLCALFPTASAKPQAKKIWCCRGWSDDLSTSTAASPKVDTYKVKGICRGQIFCNGDPSSSTPDCATNWERGEHYYAPNSTAPDCFDPKPPGEECICDSDWCNCPKELKGKETPLPDKGLKCCYGTSRYPDSIKVSQYCSGTLSCLSKKFGNTDNSTDYLSEGKPPGGFSPDYARRRDDCYEGTYKTYDDEGDTCHCHTDLCNCPPRIKNNKTEKVNTTNGSPQLHFQVLPFNLISFSSSALLLVLDFALTLALTFPFTTSKSKS